MRWFKTKKTVRAQAVLTPIPEGLAALRLEGTPQRPRLAALAVREGARPEPEALKALAAEAGLGACGLVTLLNHGDYQTLMTEAPAVPEAELQTALGWKIKDMLGFPVEEAVVEYLALPAEAGRAPALFVLVARAEAVRVVAAPFHAAKLPLEAIDVRETAQRDIARFVEPEGYAIGLLHFDGSQGLLTFSFGGELVMSRPFDARGLHPDVVNERLALEVQRSVDNFERQHAEFPLAKLFISTPSADDGVQAKLGEFLSLGTERLDLDAHFDWGGFPRLRDARVQNRLFHALGAALRGLA